FSWDQALTGPDLPGQANRAVILVRVDPDFATLSPARHAIGVIRHLGESLNLTEAQGYRLRLTGGPVLSTEEMQSVARGAGIAGIVSLALVMLLLTIGLRSA